MRRAVHVNTVVSPLEIGVADLRQAVHDLRTGVASLVVRDEAEGRRLIFYDPRSRGRSSAVTDGRQLSLEYDAADLEAFRTQREEANIPVFVHALYLVNLAAPDDSIYAKSIETMRATVDAACALEADGVVFHVGSHLGYGFGQAVKRVAPTIRELLELTTDDLWLCMENAAGASMCCVLRNL